VSTWKVILATLVIFVAGVVTGAMVMKSSRGAPLREAGPPPPWVFQGPDFVQQRFLDRMNKEMELTTEQRRKLEGILRDARERTKSWWEIVGPEFQSELKETREKIRTVLTPTQREKFEKLMRERHRTPAGQAGGDRRPRDRRPNATTNAPGGRVAPSSNTLAPAPIP
jgi:Spy/CpxP family protein refolding chaperone